MKLYLPLLLIIFCLKKTVIAQTTDTIIALKDVVIKENRLQSKFLEVANGISITDKKEIAISPATQLNEVLNYFPGIDIRTRGAFGVQSDISINGGTFDQALVLVNGIRLCDPQTGHHSLNVPMTLLNIERIEILKGAAARSYGQNAFAGAINIVTKEHQSKGMELQAVVSDYNTYQIGGAIYAPNAELGVQYQKSNGYRPNSDFEIVNFLGIDHFKIGKTVLDFTTGFTNRSFGASGFYSPTNVSNEREKIQTGFVSLGLPFFLNAMKLTPRFTVRANYDDYYYDYSTEASRSLTRNTTTTYSVNSTVDGSWKNNLGLTGFSFGLENVNYENVKLLNHNRTTTTMNLEHRFSFLKDKLTLTPDALFINYSDYGSYFTPGLDLGYNVSENATLYANYNRVVRVPTYTDLYFSNKANLANPNLQPELANNYEIGGKLFLNNVFIQTAIYKREGTNLIDRTKAVDSLPWNPTNLNTFTISGINANARFQSDKLANFKFDVGFNYVFDYQLNKVQALSKYALDFLSAQYIFGLELPRLYSIKNNFKLRLIKRISQSDVYSVLDWKATYEKKKINIFVQVQNVTNTFYTEQSNIPMPGRWFGVGSKINFNF